jgi:hypothetical protein
LTTRTNGVEKPRTLEEARDRILEALRGLRFGSVEVQVHDAQVVRITRTEKVRVEPNGEDHSDRR